MNITSTLAAPTRRGFAGLIVTTIATASAGAWALTAAASDPTDEPTTTTAATVEDVTVGRPAAVASDLVSAATRSIVVADPYPWPWITSATHSANHLHQPYHNLKSQSTTPLTSIADAYNGVGSLCRNSTDPIVVADAYHGVGVTVCR